MHMVVESQHFHLTIGIAGSGGVLCLVQISSRPPGHLRIQVMARVEVSAVRASSRRRSRSRVMRPREPSSGSRPIGCCRTRRPIHRVEIVHDYGRRSWRCWWTRRRGNTRWPSRKTWWRSRWRNRWGPAQLPTGFATLYIRRPWDAARVGMPSDFACRDDSVTCLRHAIPAPTVISWTRVSPFIPRVANTIDVKDVPPRLGGKRGHGHGSGWDVGDDARLV